MLSILCPSEGSTSLLLQVEHAAQSSIAVRPLYWSAEGDSVPHYCYQLGAVQVDKYGGLLLSGLVLLGRG